MSKFRKLQLQQARFVHISKWPIFGQDENGERKVIGFGHKTLRHKQTWLEKSKAEKARRIALLGRELEKTLSPWNTY